MDVAVGFGSSSSIKDSDETHGCKSFPVSHISSIKDEALRFGHIACEEELSRDCVCPIRN